MKTRWRGWLRCGLWALVLVLLLLPVLVFLVPRWSVAESETPPVDAIYLMSFDPRLQAAEYAVALYRQGIAPKVACLGNAITCDIFPADYARQHLLALGVAAADALVMHTPDTDCRAQLVAPLVQYARANGWRRILLVGDPVGTRMGLRVMRPKFQAAGIEVFLSYPPASRADFFDGWWRSHWKVQRLTRDVLESSLDLFYAECW